MVDNISNNHHLSGNIPVLNTEKLQQMPSKHLVPLITKKIDTYPSSTSTKLEKKKYESSKFSSNTPSKLSCNFNLLKDNSEIDYPLSISESSTIDSSPNISRSVSNSNIAYIYSNNNILASFIINSLSSINYILRLFGFWILSSILIARYFIQKLTEVPLFMATLAYNAAFMAVWPFKFTHDFIQKQRSESVYYNQDTNKQISNKYKENKLRNSFIENENYRKVIIDAFDADIKNENPITLLKTCWNRSSVFHLNDLIPITRQGSNILNYSPHSNIPLDNKLDKSLDKPSLFDARQVSSNATLVGDDFNQSNSNLLIKKESNGFNTNYIMEKEIDILNNELNRAQKTADFARIQCIKVVKSVLSCARECRKLVTSIDTDSKVDNSNISVILKNILKFMDETLLTYTTIDRIEDFSDEDEFVSVNPKNGVALAAEPSNSSNIILNRAEKEVLLMAKLDLTENKCEELEAETNLLKNELNNAIESVSRVSQDKEFLTKVLSKVTALAKEESKVLSDKVDEYETEAKQAKEWSMVLKETIVAMSKQIVDLNQKNQEVEKVKLEISSELDILKSKLSRYEMQNQELHEQMEEVSKWSMIRFL